MRSNIFQVTELRSNLVTSRIETISRASINSDALYCTRLMRSGTQISYSPGHVGECTVRIPYLVTLLMVFNMSDEVAQTQSRYSRGQRWQVLHEPQLINTKAEFSQKAALFLADSLTHCSSYTQTIALSAIICSLSNNLLTCYIISRLYSYVILYCNSFGPQ